MSKINIIACGGCGSAMLGLMYEKFNKIVTTPNAPELNMYHIDTSTANKHLTESIGAKFHHITTGVSEKELLGSGGLRASNVADTTISVENILSKESDILSKESLTVLVSSASGGSGSIISPLVMSHLIQRDIPFCIVLIGDSTTLSYAINTSDTIKTFHSMTKKYNTSVPIYYLDNNDYDTIQSVDQYVSGFFVALSLFYISDNLDIDFSDMSTFLNPSKMRPKINIESGIYYLDVVGPKDIDLLESNDKQYPLVTVRILNNNKSINIPLIGLNRKEGMILDGTLVSALESKKTLPIVLFTQTGRTNNLLSHLEKRISALNVSFEKEEIDYLDDDNGLVL